MEVQRDKTLLGIIFGLLVLVAVLGVLVFLRLQPIRVVEPIEIGLDEDVVKERPSKETKEDAPVFFSTMTHLEGGWDFVEEDEVKFLVQVEKMRTAMDYAEDYDAILTFESERPFARAMDKWGVNIFQEALDRGMGIGTHCDINPRKKRSTEEFASDILERKVLVDALVDSSENLGCAGAGGVSDWYGGMVLAGFKYIDGVVGFHYLAMPEKDRPEGWTDEAIQKEYYHNAVPVEDEKRYYPFRISKTSFEEDPEGNLVVSAGDIGEISSIGDLALSGSDDWQADCGSDCVVDMSDVNAVEDAIRSFVKTRDTSRVAKLQVYIATSKYEDPGIELFFERMQTLQDEGLIQWASQKQVYDAFVEWEEKK